MKIDTNRHLIPLLILLVTLVSRWPTLHSWWCLDDWGQLSRAAGLISREPGLPARWLSQDLWWALTWPLLGLNPTGHAVLRLVLHGIGSVLVARLAQKGTGRAGLGLIAGVLFAITPIAFTVLYWASGIQELLAGVLVLAAAERWWHNDGRRVWPTLFLGGASIFCKEPGFGLPLLIAAHLMWLGRHHFTNSWHRQWLVVGLLLAAVGIESIALFQNFATGPTDPYRTGGLAVILGNVGTFGWWLGTPGPSFTSQITWTNAGLGSLLFFGWGIWGWWCWRRGRHLALTALLAALLSLGPSLVLVQQTHPYLAYVAAAALCVALADLWPRRWPQPMWLGISFAVLAAGVGFANMDHRFNATGANGQPADPMVRAAALARQSAPAIQSQAGHGPNEAPLQLVLLQPPWRPADLQRIAKHGDRDVISSARYAALGGDLGPQLLAGPGAEAIWANSLLRAPVNARVLCETGNGFEVWGDTWQALLYAMLSDIILGFFERAEAELVRALELNANLDLFIHDPQQLEIPPGMMMSNGIAFQDWLAGQVQQGHLSAEEGDIYQESVRQVMAAVWH